MKTLLVSLAFLIATGSSALAQSQGAPFGTTGLFAACTDSKGKPVGYYQSPDPREGPAFSTVLPNGKPGIVFNLAQLDHYATSVDTKRFIFLHECGHCALGHIYVNVSRKKTNQEELAADCYAAKRGRTMGLNLTNIITDVDKLPRDPDHPSGIVRAKNIQACYSDTSGH